MASGSAPIITRVLGSLQAVAVLVRHEIGDPTLSMVDVVLPTALVGTNAS